MKLSTSIFAIAIAVVSANPFAPAKSSSSAKNAYVHNLMRGAKVVRALEEAEQQNGEEVLDVDITSYSIKFEKCQFVKTYDDDLADDEDSSTVLATRRFVIFRLCPNHSCSSCSYGYGEYMIDLESYLEATVQYQQEMQQEMCNACAECGNWGDDQVADEGQDDQQEQDEQQEQEQDEQQEEEQEQDQQQEEGDEAEGNGENANRKLQQYNVNCDSCYEKCMMIENMADAGYVDATNFLECQLIYEPDDDGKGGLYAGPMCASQGTKINIGVFTDQNCYINDSSKSVDDYLMDGNGYSLKLSHALLKTTYSSDSCVSCAAPQDNNGNNNGNNNNNGNDDGQQQQDQVLEMCEQLYEASAKCEQNHNFVASYNYYNGYYNQIANEDVVCDFIDSISAGSYDEQGDIVVSGASSYYGGGPKTTSGQKFALTFFVIGTVGLAVYAGMLHSKLTKGSAPGLSAQGGGAMA